MKKAYVRAEFMQRIGESWKHFFLDYSFTNPLLSIAVSRWDIVREACFETLLERWL